MQKSILCNNIKDAFFWVYVVNSGRLLEMKLLFFKKLRYGSFPGPMADKVNVESLKRWFVWKLPKLVLTWDLLT